MATGGEPGARHETSTGGTGTTRILEHEDLEIDGDSTTEWGGGHQGVKRHQGGIGERGQRGGEKEAAEESRPRSRGKTPRGAVQVLMTAWTRS